MFEFLRKTWRAREVRNKIIFVAIMLLVFRIVAHIPVPGPDPVVIQKFLASFFGNQNLLGVLNLFSGGAISNFSIVMMGLSPYINASIIMQLLTIIVPSFEALSKEGESGREKINYYARLLTIPLAALQGYGMLMLIKKSSVQFGQDIIGNPTLWQWALMIGSICAGTIFLMWLGEIITEKGIGNGISLLIFAGIVSGIPQGIAQNFSIIAGDTSKLISMGGILIAGLAVILAVIYMNEGKRAIPISYARQVRSTRMPGFTETHLPLKINIAGVIPIIFAMSFMFIPQFIGNFFTQAKTAFVANAARAIDIFFKNQTNYNAMLFALIVAFTFFYVGVIFKPAEVSENLQKRGGFIPGTRPGKETASFLSQVLYRITIWGAFFLGLIAILPFIVEETAGVQTIAIGGTGLLIVVSVVLETARQIKAQVLMQSYDIYS